ncbi:hypothetical protein ACHAXA_009577 [Cyclostephanos tholiformis]|uniref:Protein kinase domain-containing protein n=1 Tax=Cyclostephanos tholiformis TaxID=382380 RepID=A0ABD3RWX5_9STRA
MAILANLNHPNIIKLHSCPNRHLADAFMLNDGYFILLDRLSKTLHDCIDSWKVDPAFSWVTPIMKPIKVAHAVANAMAYPHSKRIIFHNLKPKNVGFDSTGVVKLFNFGLAIGMPEDDAIFHRCSTR